MVSNEFHVLLITPLLQDFDELTFFVDLIQLVGACNVKATKFS
jgi:hypothetical protein